ncbi:hypothetical protein LLH23_23625 [bacterium]|nr:hypothetical protein [bacterium]
MLTRKVARCIALVLVLLAALSVVQGQEEAGVGDPGWPRRFVGSAGEQVVVFQPQLLAWPNYRAVDFLVAVSVQPKGSSEPYVGSVRITADTSADIDSRTVLLTNPKLREANFPSADQETLARIEQKTKSLMKTGAKTISLDRLLAAAVKLEAPVKGVAVKYDPPPIFYSERPAILVVTDGDPVLCPIEKTGLMDAVNTNWDLFYEQATTSYYLRYESSWLRATTLAGPWQPAEKLPVDLGRLPDDDNWKDVKGNVPGKPIPAARLPQVFTSTKPAELLLINGRPQFTPITGVAGLLYVANTDSDLFLCGRDSQYYLLCAGRWFKSPDPAQGKWEAVKSSLPPEFAQIPPDSPKGRVRVSVPGTEQAREAAITAQIPQTATVKIADVGMKVSYNGEPQFAPIQGTSVQYATNTPYSVLRVADRYYCCFQGVWFASNTPSGPWAVTGSVPAEVYTIPPSAPVYEVTNVTVVEDDSDRGEVTFAFAAGLLLGALVADDGCVVYGTGWYHPPYVWLPPPAYFRYPVYYPWRFTYGSGVYYNPTYGIYQSRGRYYGPYGGAGWGAAYNPATGTYARGVAAYGPYASGAAGAAYNPYTGAYARGAALSGPNASAAYINAYNPSTGRGVTSYSRSSPYASWGQTAVTNGNEWAKTGYYRTSQGEVRGFETSRDTSGVRWDTTKGSGFVVEGDNNTYAGHDGNVYKRTDNGWQKWDDGSWDPVEPPLKTGAGTAGRAQNRVLQSDIATQLQSEHQVRTLGQQRARDFQASRPGARGQGTAWGGGHRQGSGGTRPGGGAGRGGRR